MCGNYVTTMKNYLKHEGSPPRVRELRYTYVFYRKRTRITPACAGITASRGMWILGRQDHPRVCGNYKLPPAGFASSRGSPPRVRELLFLSEMNFK